MSKSLIIFCAFFFCPHGRICFTRAVWLKKLSACLLFKIDIYSGHFCFYKRDAELPYRLHVLMYLEFLKTAANFCGGKIFFIDWA